MMQTDERATFDFNIADFTNDFIQQQHLPQDAVGERNERDTFSYTDRESVMKDALITKAKSLIIELKEELISSKQDIEALKKKNIELLEELQIATREKLRAEESSRQRLDQPQAGPPKGYEKLFESSPSLTASSIAAQPKSARVPARSGHLDVGAKVAQGEGRGARIRQRRAEGRLLRARKSSRARSGSSTSCQSA